MEKKINNTLLLGGFGTDNVDGYFIDNINKNISNSENIFIIDKDKKLLNQIGNELVKSNYNTLIFDIDDMKHSLSFNPYIIPYRMYKNGNEQEAIEYVEKINRLLIKSDSSIDPFWEESGTDLFTACVLYLFDKEECEDKINIYNAYRLLMLSSSDSSEFKKLMNSSTNTVKLYSFGYINAPHETKGGIFSVVNLKIRLFVTSNCSINLLLKNSFDFDKILNEKTAIVLNVKGEKSNYNKIGVAFIDTLLYFFKNNKLKYNVYIKDASNLGNIDIIEYIVKSNNSLFNISLSNVYLDEFKSVYNNLSDYLNIIDADKLEYEKLENKVSNIEIPNNDFNEEISLDSLIDFSIYDTDTLIKLIDKKIEELNNENK